MSGTTTPAGDALIEAQAVPVGGAERDVVAAIRRVLLGFGSPPADTLLGGDLDVMVLDRRVNEAWRLRQGSRYMELGQMLPALGGVPLMVEKRGRGLPMADPMRRG